MIGIIIQKIFRSRNTVRQIAKTAYESGLERGWLLAMEYKESGNKGFIVGTRVDAEVEEILKKSGM